MAEESTNQALATITATGDYRVLMDGATVECPASALGGATYVVGERVTVTVRNPRPPLIEGVEDTILPASNVEGPRTVPPRGVVMFWPTANPAPAGYLLCDGSTYNTSDYPYLAEFLGATGETFTVPDYRDRFLYGAGAKAVGVRGGEETHLLTAAESGIRNHTHALPMAASGGPSGTGDVPLRASGAGDPNFRTSGVQVADAAYGSAAMIDAPASAAHNNMPPFEVVNYIIKA